jgi:predicted Zn finger-like uncharacterized protein
MKLDEGIRKHGFRKWYERELLQSHAHMALAFLCAVGVFAAFEASAGALDWVDRLIDVLAVLVCGGVGVWAIRRYLWLLGNAEAIAHQADCPSCQTYARLEVRSVPVDGVRVRCKKCGHEWTIWV